ncbi:MAG: S46 family peptidase [Ignavibacteriae bacterium]|nr:S46 family peptidase [Ignavibacteriota bacterium]
MLKRILFLILVLTASRLNADEGMWLLDAISKLPIAEMKSHGLELTPEQIFSNTNASLKDAIVLLPGGTGGFISAEGLIVTNHHIAFAGIQELSSVQDDYLKNGFVATSKDKELETSYTAEIVQTITDITSEVLSVVNDTMRAEERERAIRSKRKEIEDKMQDSTKLACRVTDVFGGVKFYLFTSLQLKDVRLVYAPPSAIGVFGGETDNWMWPRHTGDFSLLRAYIGPDGKPAKYAKENIPYKPRNFMPVSTQGTPEGSYAMVMGFPGRTYRYREAAAVQLAQEETLPLTQELYKVRTGIIERWGQKDRAIAIKYATKLRRLANSQKNFVATLAGLRRTDLVNRKKAEEARFASSIASNPELSNKYGTVLSDLKSANDELRATNRKNIYLGGLGGAVEALGVAGRLVTYLNSLKKDEKGTLREPTDKDRQPVIAYLTDLFKDYDVNVDKDMLTAMILKNADLPAEHQSKTITEIYKDKTGNERERRVRAFVDDLFEDTQLASLEGCMELLNDDPEDILDDVVVKFFRKYSAEAAPTSAKQQSVLGKLARLRTKFVGAWLEWKKCDVSYPDANRSLRFTYGEVVPLAPRDAVVYSTTTTLTGIMQKESDTEEFQVPAKLKELWKAKDFGGYADPTLKDVPVAFISNLDITGGNSGSPVINGKGELIGCAFDGNWDGVVADYIYEERMNRCIAVDSRYMLFVIDKFSGAENILKELVIH